MNVREKFDKHPAYAFRLAYFPRSFQQWREYDREHRQKLCDFLCKLICDRVDEHCGEPEPEPGNGDPYYCVMEPAPEAGPGCFIRRCYDERGNLIGEYGPYCP